METEEVIWPSDQNTHEQNLHSWTWWYNLP